jgi:hypothetical protein
MMRSDHFQFIRLLGSEKNNENQSVAHILTGAPVCTVFTFWSLQLCSSATLQG